MQHFTLNFWPSIASPWAKVKSPGLQDKIQIHLCHSKPPRFCPILFSAHLLLQSLYTLSPSHPGAFHLFLLPGVLPHPSTQLKYPFLQEDFQPLRPRSKVSSSHLQAELTPLSAHSWRPDFYCVLLHSFFKELPFQCGKHCDSVIYNHTRTSCEGSIEVEATSSPWVGEGVGESIIRRVAFGRESQVLVDSIETESSF